MLRFLNSFFLEFLQFKKSFFPSLFQKLTFLVQKLNLSVNMSFYFFTVKNGPTEVSISVAARGLQVAASFGRSGRGPLPRPGNPAELS